MKNNKLKTYIYEVSSALDILGVIILSVKTAICISRFLWEAAYFYSNIQPLVLQNS